ncbi:hypothetical protein H5410_061530 [Solanum commersonii]|uniref:Uncharacterized protein n=1 Tax=Solanum commersonii TaxID=4109 RepID=A0A9J5W952_SOLCO|nr:hypothetical protein H5410_061530 [Solanum commersonii]
MSWPPLEEQSTREQESVNLHHYQGQTLDELVTAKELIGEELPQGEGASTTPIDQEEPLLKGVINQRQSLEELSTGEGESATPHHSKGPILDEVATLEEESTRERESTTLYPSQESIIDNVVIAKELPTEELCRGERASAGPNDQEPFLKGVIIQRPPLEEQYAEEREYATQYHSQVKTLDELVIAKKLSTEELPQGEGASTPSNDQEEPLLKGPTLDEVVISKELSAKELPQGEGASAIPNYQEETPIKEELPQGEGASAIPNYQEETPVKEELPQGEEASVAPNDLRRTPVKRLPFEELSTEEEESATTHPNQEPTLDEVVISKELPSTLLPLGKSALAAPNDKKEPLLKGFVIQRTPLEELSKGKGESTTPHHSQGTILNMLVIVKECSTEKLPQGEGASTAPNDQEEPLLKGVVIQRIPL